MLKSQENKYDANNTNIFNRHTGEMIPEDEPIMIFRAKDKHAAAAVEFYMEQCKDIQHQVAIQDRLIAFMDFADKHPERMSEPTS